MIALRACAETGLGHFDIWNTMLLLLHSINERLGGEEGATVELPHDWLGETIETWTAQKMPLPANADEGTLDFARTLKGR